MVLPTLGSIVLALALALPVGLHQHVGQDFHVFWQAGRNFASGGPLYHGYVPGARQFKYPPFAALAFTPLALFPLPIAAVLMSLVNLALWAGAVVLTRDILAEVVSGGNRSRVPVVAAVILSAQFFLDNFHHVQVNGLTLFLVLFGARDVLRGRDIRAALSIVIAIAIKLTPVLFAFWLVIRGRRRSVLSIMAFAAGCVLIPLALRGPRAGSAELVEYYHSFLEGHQHGAVGSYTAGQNVAALVSRMMRRPDDPRRPSYRYLPASERTAQLAYRGLWLTVLLAFVVRVMLLRLGRAPVSAFELAMVFLTSMLLSPITFTTHLVPLLFVFATVLSVRPPKPWLPIAVPVIVLILACGLSGRDFAGDRVYRDMAGYSVYVWTMLVLLGITMTFAGRDRDHAARV